MAGTVNTISQWFRIEASEKPWIVSFIGGIFFAAAANTLAWNLLQALIIKRLDVAWLPVFYVGSSFAYYLGAWFALTLLKKSRAMMQSIEMMLLAIPLTLVFAFVQQLFGKDISVFLLILFAAFGLIITTSLLYIGLHKFLNSPTDFFNVEQMQRFEPLFSSTMQLGGMAAGGLAALLSATFNSTLMFLVVPVLLLLAMPFFAKLKKLAKEASVGALIIDDVVLIKTKKKSWGLAKIFKDQKIRRFVLLLGIIMALYVVFMRIFSYEMAIAANSRFPTESELNEFIGIYTAVVSITVLIYINTLQRWLFKRFGLTFNLFIPPIVILAGVIAMVFFPVFWIVIGAVFLREVIIFLQKSSMNLSLNGLSDYQRSQAWTWINGPALTIGNLAGSSLLGIIAYVLSDAKTEITIQAVAVFAAVLLIFQFYITFRVRKVYLDVLLHSLIKGDFKTRVRSMEAMTEVKHMQDHHLTEILNIVTNSKEPVDLQISALRTISVIGDPSVLRVIGKLLSSDKIKLRREAYRTIAAFSYTMEQLFNFGFSRQTLLSRLREAFIHEQDPQAIEEILAALMSLRDPDIVPFIIDLMKKGSDIMRASCLYSLRNFHDPGIIDVVRPYVHSENPRIKAMSVKALWQFKWEHGQLMPVLWELLNAPADSEMEEHGFYLIGSLHLPEYRSKLIEGLKRKNKVNQLVAAVALLKIDDEAGIGIIDKALREGSDFDAFEIGRLTNHPDVSEREEQRIQSLIHLHHLHYPDNSPVVEPLRIRLCNIPKMCLRDLVKIYKKHEDYNELKKIYQAIKHIKNLPPVKGTVALIGLDADWQEMAEIALLANRYKTRTIKKSSEIEAEDIIIAFEEVKDLKPDSDTIVLSVSTENECENCVLRTHYAPSELLAVVNRLFDERVKKIEAAGNK